MPSRQVKIGPLTGDRRGFLIAGLALFIVVPVAVILIVKYSREVPEVTGLSLSAAREATDAKDLDIEVKGSGNGKVCRQDPEAGDVAFAGDVLTAYIGTECQERSPEPTPATTTASTTTAPPETDRPTEPPDADQARLATRYREWLVAEHQYGADLTSCASEAAADSRFADDCFRFAGLPFRTMAGRLSQTVSGVAAKLGGGTCRDNLNAFRTDSERLSHALATARSAGIDLNRGSFGQASDAVRRVAPTATAAGESAVESCSATGALRPPKETLLFRFIQAAATGAQNDAGIKCLTKLGGTSNTSICDRYHLAFACINAKDSFAGIDTCLAEYPPGEFSTFDSAQQRLQACLSNNFRGSACTVRP